MLHQTSLLVGALLVHFCVTLPDYQQRIPNGNKVPHPCIDAFVWKGVGHQNHEGGGFLNPFGEDFRTNGFRWNKCLCEVDSDGDGMTNGEELGDPNCVWTEGDLAEIIDPPSHPGVCEPVDSELCLELNTFDPCIPIDFHCNGMDDPDTFTTETRFTEITIPNRETTYWCYAVQFNETEDYHAFAMEPILDNVNLVHHIDMYECPPGAQTDNALKEYSEPSECGAMAGCGGNMLAAWALGIEGICMPDDVGIRIGKYGAQVAVLRIHYHNPFLKSGERDASGLLFHMTPNIRENDAQVLNMGQMYLALPPGQLNMERSISCSEFCTNTFQQDIKLAFGTMHMHYLGTGGYAELWREGKKVRTIMSQDFYDYNAPHLEIFDPPIDVKVGDTLKAVCRFQSRDRPNWTYRGRSAYDEMCHFYYVHYPAQNLTECFNEGAIETCKYRFQDGRETMSLGDCDMDDFNQAYDDYVFDYISSVCDDSEENQQCLPGCKEACDWAIANQTCLHQTEPDTYNYTLKAKDAEFRRMMHSCVDVPPPPPNSNPTVASLDCGDGSASLQSVAVLIMLSSLLATLMKKF